MSRWFCIRHTKFWHYVSLKYVTIICCSHLLYAFPHNSNYPQDLTISVSTERSSQEIEILEDQQSLSSVNTRAFLDASEWSLYNHTETYRDETTVEYARSTVHPILHVQCRVARKIGYFVWNIIFIVVSIVHISLLHDMWVITVWNLHSNVILFVHFVFWLTND